MNEVKTFCSIITNNYFDDCVAGAFAYRAAGGNLSDSCATTLRTYNTTGQDNYSNMSDVDYFQAREGVLKIVKHTYSNGCETPGWGYNYRCVDATGKVVMMNPTSSNPCPANSTRMPNVALYQLDETYSTTRGGGASGFYFFNEQTCSLIPYSTAASQPFCDFGEYKFYATPISLLWKSTTKLSAVATKLVRFNLGAKPNDSVWYEWKGSSETPLLVYDPRHTGIITSSSQLFGEWTFGGKKVASLNASTTSPDELKWRDGYEALASLDSNQDGELSGDEIASLGLWFDHNQDGISQRGEVVAVADSGVEKLFYTPDIKDQASRSLYASRGYVRRVKDHEYTGASVDWYGQEHKTPLELMLNRGLMGINENNSALDVGLQEVAPSNASKASTRGASGLRGMWDWSSPAKTFARGQAPAGTFLLTDDGDSRLEGIAFVTTEVFNNSTGAGTGQSMIQLQHFTGSYSFDRSGETSFTFSRVFGLGQYELTKGTLNSKTGELEGTTKVRVTEGTDTVEFEFPWKARPFSVTKK